MKLSAGDVKQRLNKLLDFFEPMHSVAGAYLGSFFTENLWNLVPMNIQMELNNMTAVDDFIHYYTDIIRNNSPTYFAENYPHVFNYVTNALNLSILNNHDFLFNFEDLFLIKNYSDKQVQLLSPVMTEKKLHEVQTTAKITVLLSNHTKSSHIVDVGAGKGYLSSILALNYECKVLGLEISQEKTCSALKRSKLIAQNIKNEFGMSNVRGSKKKLVQERYKQAVATVGADTNISTLLREHFNDVNRITITGLHTCGDLSCACLQMFLDNEEIKGILNIGCCYHFISEEFAEGQTIREGKNETDMKFGFPLSLYLRRRKCFLGRNVRMLSAHSLDRINFELGATQTSLLYRAILETVLEKHNHTGSEGDPSKLPKRVAKCEDFHQYVQQSLKHLGLKVQLTDGDIAELYDTYKDKKPLLTAFFLLRVTLAPVVESIILLDRMLYLIENKHGLSEALLKKVEGDRYKKKHVQIHQVGSRGTKTNGKLTSYRMRVSASLQASLQNIEARVRMPRAHSLLNRRVQRIANEKGSTLTQWRQLKNFKF